MNKFICRSTFLLLLIGVIFSSFLLQPSVKANQFHMTATQNKSISNPQQNLPSFIDSKWAGFLSITSNLYPIKKGKADFYTGTLPLKSNYYTTITMKLQRYKSGSWKTIKTGTTKGKGSQLFSDYYYVSKGYKYRCTASIKIYKSKGGKLINQHSLTTNTRKY